MLAPHPDDETLGCGGAIALHCQAGDAVKVVFITDGSKGGSYPSVGQESCKRIRRDEGTQACKVLGVEDYDFWEFEDRSLARLTGMICLVELPA